MKGKYTGIILVILNIALLGGIGYLYYQQDHAAPRIKVEETDFVYEEDMEEALLLEGVTAYDNEDGDITARIIIEKIVTDPAKEKATITYGAADSSGNISKATRTVKMKIEEIVEIVEEEAETEEESNEETETEEESSEEDNHGENASQTVTNKPAQTSKPVQENKPTQTSKPAQENKPAQASKPAQTNQSSQTTTQQSGNSKAPSIKFSSTKVKTNVGGNPAWVNVIEGLYDDRDDYVTLFKTIKVTGNYNKNKRGTYQVHVTVTDSDGNVSNAYPVEIVVE